ncbi:MAG TPA: cupredoxin domain-containing protein [Mycobacterium sp.]|nr:cupredoxin domain-containing protein [Mycobacterium sp.]
MSQIRKSAAAAAAAVALLTATACGGTASHKADVPTTTAAAGPPAATITIDNFMFGSPASVPAGATIAVKNSDPAEHSVTADSGGVFDVDVDANGKATFTAPSKPGSYPYHCSYHPMMHGTLVVG